MSDNDFDVIIIGGGPCGLLSSLLLARYGISSLLLERHPDISVHPKAMGIMRRTGEIYRQLGLYDAMQGADIAANGDYALSVWTRGLTNEVLGVTPYLETAGAVTPCRRFHCPQPHTEAVIARQLWHHDEATVKHFVEAEAVEEIDGGVRVKYVDRDSGEKHLATARYLIAADGATSPTREQLGISVDGPGDMGHFINTYFRAPYGSLLEDRRALLYQAIDPEFCEFFVTVNGHDLWLMHHFLQPGESVTDYPESRIREIIKQASGEPDIPVEIISILPWVMSPKIARQWRHGRVLLVGDAAARLSPSGGLGMNTGLQGVHNLAWKLAAVLKGIAAETLLDSYQTERLPVAAFSSENSNDNFHEIYEIVECGMRGDFDQARDKIAHSRRAGSQLGQDLGMAYESGAIVPDSSAGPSIADPINDYTATGRPGHRAPHLWLDADKSRSTLDLFGSGFAVLAGPDGGGWAQALVDDAWPLRAPFAAEFTLIEAPEFPELYGIEPDGAVLVRPDGYVGARFPSLAQSRTQALVDAARRVLGRE